MYPRFFIAIELPWAVVGPSVSMAMRCVTMFVTVCDRRAELPRRRFPPPAGVLRTPQCPDQGLPLSPYSGGGGISGGNGGFPPRDHVRTIFSHANLSPPHMAKFRGIYHPGMERGGSDPPPLVGGNPPVT